MRLRYSFSGPRSEASGRRRGGRSRAGRRTGAPLEHLQLRRFRVGLTSSAIPPYGVEILETASGAVTSPLDTLRASLAGRYTIDRELGRGGMATVYLSEVVKHRRLVALKLLRPDLAAALGTNRFLQEIEIAARLQHPNVLPLYDS